MCHLVPDRSFRKKKQKLLKSSEMDQGIQICNLLANQMIPTSKWRPYLKKIIYVISSSKLIYSYLNGCREKIVCSDTTLIKCHKVFSYLLSLALNLFLYFGHSLSYLFLLSLCHSVSLSLTLSCSLSLPLYPFLY